MTCDGRAVLKRADGYEVVRCERDRHDWPGGGVHLAMVNGRLVCWLPIDEQQRTGRSSTDVADSIF